MMLFFFADSANAQVHAASAIKKIFACAVVLISSCATMCGMAYEEQLRLAGKLRSVRVEKANFRRENNKWHEGPRNLTKLVFYDSEGNLIREATYALGVVPNGAEYRVSYTHDQSGHITEAEERNVEGLLTSKKFFIRDVTGRVIEHRTEDAKGSLSGRVTYSYNAGGQIAEQAFYDSRNWLISRSLYAYDAGGRTMGIEMHAGLVGGNAFINIHERLVQDPTYSDLALPISKTRFAYDGEGGLAHSETSGRDGRLIKKVIFSKENNNSKVEEISFNPDGTAAARELRQFDAVDAHGNSTKVTILKWREESHSFEPFEAIYTTYAYYE